MFKRMGELLVECGELSEEQLARIVAEQKRCYQPFGQIAARLFHVDEHAIWRAWALQYARFCPHVEVAAEPRDDGVQANLPSMSAWHLRLLPLRWNDGDLVLVTCLNRLAKALQYVDEHVDAPTVIWLTESIHALEDALRAAYPNCDREPVTLQHPPRADVA